MLACSPEVLVRQNKKLRFSAQLEASSITFQLFHGQLGLENYRSAPVCAGKCWVAALKP
jgi:hypothetical protein